MAPSHEERVARILKKLNEVRRKGLSCFGSDSHRFRLNPPLDEHALSVFESSHGLQLPPDYRSFLRLAGNGGAGPYYGIYKLDQWDHFFNWTTDPPPADLVARPCPLHPGMARDSDWERQFPDCASPYQGTICIGSQGCTYAMGLIVTGQYAGRVVYFDADGQAPYVVREPDFLSWYERWLDELLGDYDMLWFGYGPGGDESQLFAMLDDPATPEADRIDVVYAIRRLPALSARGQERICRLLSDSVAGVRAAGCYVVDRFQIVSAAPFCAGLLNDASTEVQKAAIGVSMYLNPDAHAEQVAQLLYSDDLEVAQTAFFGLQNQRRLSRDVLLPLVQSSPPGGLRCLVANAIRWRPEDEDLLIRLLDDEEPQVRLYAVDGLRQISAASSLDKVIEMLPRETDDNTIDRILRMLGDVPGEKNADVLLAWAQQGDDFHQLCAIDSLCKLGDIRVEPLARLLLDETRPPQRQDENGFPSMSHVKSIRELVSASLCSSPNRSLRRLGAAHRWFKWLPIRPRRKRENPQS